MIIANSRFQTQATQWVNSVTGTRGVSKVFTLSSLSAKPKAMPQTKRSFSAAPMCGKMML
jgi:hypothetical protein